MSRYDKKRNRPDDFQTMPWALDVLMPYLKPEWIVWEPAAGLGYLVNGLLDRGQRGVIASDILPIARWKDSMRWQADFLARATPEDFTTHEERFDMILTNPPFSLKDEFVARCYEIGKPFALLMPFTGLEGQVKQRLYAEHGISMVFLPGRGNKKNPLFRTPSQIKDPSGGRNSGSWFPAAWFCWGLQLPAQLNFNPPAEETKRGGFRQGAAPVIAKLDIGQTAFSI